MQLISSQLPPQVLSLITSLKVSAPIYWHKSGCWTQLTFYITKRFSRGIHSVLWSQLLGVRPQTSPPLHPRWGVPYVGVKPPDPSLPSPFRQWIHHWLPKTSSWSVRNSGKFWEFLHSFTRILSRSTFGAMTIKGQPTHAQGMERRIKIISCPMQYMAWDRI